MRRNSNIIEKRGMRSGIAMIMAIGFLVIMAGILASMLNMTAVTTKRTEHSFFKEQAQLLARSATEYAILAISGHDRANNTDCITRIDSLYPPGANAFFTIRTNIRYIGLIGGAGADCTNYINTPFPVTGSNIAPESEGTVLIDVYVTSLPALNTAEPIAFHRRTLQKP